MQLRSGKVCVPPTKQAKTQENKDPDYSQHSEVVASTLRYYAAVRKREQYELAKFINEEFIPKVLMMQRDSLNPPDGVDKVFHRVRTWTALFELLNTTSEKVIMNPVFDANFTIILNMCDVLKNDAEKLINERTNYPAEDSECSARSSSSLQASVLHARPYLNLLNQIDIFQSTYSDR